jgi:hypothetical protein
MGEPAYVFGITIRIIVFGGVMCRCASSFATSKALQINQDQLFTVSFRQTPCRETKHPSDTHTSTTS